LNNLVLGSAIDDRHHSSDGKLMYTPYSRHSGKDEDIRRINLLVSWRNTIQEVGERVLRTIILNKMHLLGLSARNQSTQPNLKDLIDVAVVVTIININIIIVICCRSHQHPQHHHLHYV
jgi:hypothetical protein